MDTNKILSAHILDLVFEGRNKDYGAYELRVTYPERVKKSLLIILGLAVVISAGAMLGNKLKPAHDPGYTSREVILSEIKEEEKPKPVVEVKQPEVQPIRTERYTQIIITNQEVVDPPPTQEDLNTAKIDLHKVDGRENDFVPQDKPIDNTGIIETRKPQEPGDDIFTAVEIPSKFSGNWQAFLLRNLNGQVAVDNGAPAGRHTVIIQFVVDKEGNVSDIKALTSVGYGMEEEAIRVIKKAPKWEPGIQSGYKVKSYHKQPITFEIPEEE
jgi:protein TonB